MTSMRRVVIHPGQIAVETADIPVPGPDEALIRTLVAGVCGSDLHAARGHHPFVGLPYRPGHEVVGVVEMTGSPVSRLRARTAGHGGALPALLELQNVRLRPGEPV